MSGGFEDGDLDLEAAEYVIGTLDREERASFAERLQRDGAAQRSVAAWEQRCAGLAGGVDPINPPPSVWTRIQTILDAPAFKPHQLKVIDGGRQTSDGTALQRSRNRWRTGALLSGSVAAALLVFVVDQTFRASEAPDTTYVAAVNRGGDKPALIVRVDLKTGQVLVRPVAATAPTGQSLELWYIGANKTPRSMGLVADEPAHLTLPPGAGTDNATFAVSVEPPGGSKTGGPTGPVVYAGQLIKE